MQNTSASNLHFDVCIIGAGPAGSYLAYLLSKQKIKTLLIERNSSIEINNFSSAGMTVDGVNDYEIPPSVIGAYWNKLEVHSTNNISDWKSDDMKGVVLEFWKLKKHYIDLAIENGGQILMGHEYVKHNIENSIVAIQIKNSEELLTIQSKLLIDATGSRCKALNTNLQHKLVATGIEFRIRTTELKEYDNKLVFFLGYKWSPKGYGWIFPMGNNEYKVGIGVYNTKSQVNLSEFTDNLIRDHLKLSKYELIDKHGGTLVIPNFSKFKYYQGQVLAIGDAAFTVNPLGGEGIRHALYSSKIASKYIVNFLDGDSNSFKNYEIEMRKYKGSKWKFSKILAQIVYLYAPDSLIDFMVKKIQRLSFTEILDILFKYKYIAAIKTSFLKIF